MYKHYIRTDTDGIVVHGYTTAFLREAGGSEEIILGDTQIKGIDDRLFQIPLTTERRQFKYKIAVGKMVERTQEELDAEWDARPPQPEPLEEKAERLASHTQQLDERTIGMQAVDDFTLETLMTTDERTAGMREIDDFTLALVFEQATLIQTLTERIEQLEGGTANGV